MQAAGFEFDAELAEWLRWFNEIRAFHQREGHCQPQPLAHPNGACATIGACCLAPRGVCCLWQHGSMFVLFCMHACMHAARSCACRLPAGCLYRTKWLGLALLPLPSPPFLAAPVPVIAADFLLINWCSVQRIMRRCGVLAPERVTLLDGLGFDWSGADPLS